MLSIPVSPKWTVFIFRLSYKESRLFPCRAKWGYLDFSDETEIWIPKCLERNFEMVHSAVAKCVFPNRLLFLKKWNRVTNTLWRSSQLPQASHFSSEVSGRIFEIRCEVLNQFPVSAVSLLVSNHYCCIRTIWLDELFSIHAGATLSSRNVSNAHYR